MIRLLNLDDGAPAQPVGAVSRWPRTCPHGDNYYCGCAGLWIRLRLMERAMRAPGQ